MIKIDESKLWSLSCRTQPIILLLCAVCIFTYFISGGFNTIIILRSSCLSMIIYCAITVFLSYRQLVFIERYMNLQIDKLNAMTNTVKGE